MEKRFIITSRSWKYESGIVSACLDFIVGDQIVFYDTEWSLTHSVPALVRAARYGHRDDPHALFYCTCGMVSCDSMNFYIEHRNDQVVLSEFSRRGKGLRFGVFEVSRECFIEEITCLCDEFFEFEYCITPSAATTGREEWQNHSLFLKELLKSPATPYELNQDDAGDNFLNWLVHQRTPRETLSFLREFPWTCDRLLELLHDEREVARYRAVEAIGILGDENLTMYVADKLLDESEAVRYMATKSLARMGILRSYEYVDEFFVKRQWRKGCQRNRLRGRHMAASNAHLALAGLLRHTDSIVSSKSLDIMGKLLPLRDKFLLTEVSEFAQNKLLPYEQRAKALTILEKSSPGVFSMFLSEILNDPLESFELKEVCLALSEKLQTYDVLEGIERMAASKTEDPELRKAAHFILTRRSWKTYLFSPAGGFMMAAMVFCVLGFIFSGSPLIRITGTAAIFVGFFYLWLASRR